MIDINKCKHYWSITAKPKCMYCSARWNDMTGKICHINPNCKDAKKCNPHGEFGPVTYKNEKSS